MKTLRNHLSAYDLFGLFAVMITTIYRPLTVWMFHFDGAGRIPTFCSIFSLIVLFPRIRHYLVSKPFIFYFLVVVFQYVNGLIKGSYLNYERDGLYLMTVHIFLPLFSSLFVYNAARKQFAFTLKFCTATLFLYSIICFFCGGLLSSIDRYSYDVNSNEIAFYCATSVGLFILCYLQRLIKWYVLPLTAIPLACVIITASRMGIVMVAIMMFGFWYIISHKKHRSTTGFLASSAVFVVILLGLILMMSYSEVGERLSSTTNQIEGQDDRLTGTILDHFGDRGPQYYFSWPYFLEHPVTGIGIGNWSKYNPTGLVCHSEYMVQYLEGGLIALILYCLFWISMFKSLFLKKSKASDNRFTASRTCLVFILISIIFANSVLWSYDMYCVFIVYALASGFSLSRDNNTSYRIISTHTNVLEKKTQINADCREC